MSMNFWTLSESRKFHQGVVGLQSLTVVPVLPRSYPLVDVPESEDYVLSLSDELLLVDHIAFLAANEEGARTVSAVMAEEHDGGKKLVLRLAANETATSEVREGLKGVLDIVMEYAARGESVVFETVSGLWNSKPDSISQGKRRGEAKEMLFDKVVQFSATRIHQRLRSSKQPMPWWVRNPGSDHKPLHTRLREGTRRLGARFRSAFPGIAGRLEELASTYEVIDKADNATEITLLKKAIVDSAKASGCDRTRSIEAYIKSFGKGAFAAFSESKEVLEIDKLGRYFHLCNDLLRMARRDRSKDLLKDVELEFCESPFQLSPQGSNGKCHVHGEVQLILHYEQFPYTPPPRAIGSSKLACFLCDLFIRKHGKHRVGQSHRRLYEKWTIPDVNWMTKDQTRAFQRIVSQMSAEIAQLRSGRDIGNPYPIESRTNLLHYPDRGLSTPSLLSQQSVPEAQRLEIPIGDCAANSGTEETLTELVCGTGIAIADNIVESQKSYASSSSSEISTMSFNSQDLPLTHDVTVSTPSLRLVYGQASLDLEFMKVAKGRISISHLDDADSSQSSQVIDVLSIPTATEMVLGCKKDTNQLVWHLGVKGDVLRLQFTWG
jgi:hypothetical protein